MEVFISQDDGGQKIYTAGELQTCVGLGFRKNPEPQLDVKSITTYLSIFSFSRNIQTKYQKVKVKGASISVGYFTVCIYSTNESSFDI